MRALLAGTAILLAQATAVAAQQDSVFAIQQSGSTLLRLNADAGFVVAGAQNVGDIPRTGAGVRMMWFPARWAFRAGKVDSSGSAYWDLGNIGNGSVGLGENVRASGDNSFAAGLATTASGVGTVAIGSQSSASGQFSVAIGKNASTATRQGSVVLGDGCGYFRSDSVFPTADNQFVVRACGGIKLYTSIFLSSGVEVAAGGGSWSSISDRNRKMNFLDVDGEDVLARLRSVPVTSWSYITQGESIRHMGPVAQDFRAAFGLGENDVTINTIDIDGVNLAGVKALDARTLEQARTIGELRDQVLDLTRQNSDLARQNAELKQRLERLELLILEKKP